MAESFFGNLKNELVHHSDFATRDAARATIFDYTELFYNRSRMHQSLGYVSPVRFKQINGVLDYGVRNTRVSSGWPL